VCPESVGVVTAEPKNFDSDGDVAHVLIGNRLGSQQHVGVVGTRHDLLGVTERILVPTAGWTVQGTVVSLLAPEVVRRSVGVDLVEPHSEIRLGKPAPCRHLPTLCALDLEQHTARRACEPHLGDDALPDRTDGDVD